MTIEQECKPGFAKARPSHPDTQVIALNHGKWEEPCVEVHKARCAGARGELIFERWCYIHSHWLNGAPAKNIVTKMVEDCSAATRPE